MIVEDDRDAAEMLSVFLQSHGHTSEQAHTADAAMTAMALRKPDVVLIDIGLPEVDGYALARRARDMLGAAVRLIATTGHDALPTARDAGFDAWLRKPLRLETLGEAIVGARR